MSFRRHPESWQLGERADDVLGDSISEELAVIVSIGAMKGTATGNVSGPAFHRACARADFKSAMVA
jgi:hypothetical protein